MTDRPTPDADASLARPPLEPAELAADPRRLAAVLATVLDQQGRDAAANRAQARELIRAVDGLAKAHEYLGKELSDERGRTRALLVAVVLLAVAVVAAGGLAAWSSSGPDERLDALRADVARDVRELRERNDSERIEGLRTDYEARLRSATGDVAALRTDLDATRTALADERRAREEREAAAAARLAAADRELAELTGLRAELRSVRDLAGAEKARSDQLARALAEAARAPRESLPADGSAAPVVPSGTPAVAAPTAAPSAPPTAAPARPPVAAPPDPPPATSTGASAATATRDPSDLGRIRDTLNGLLDGATGVAHYRLERIDAVSGKDLMGVQVVGRDDSGRTLRTVESARLEVSVSEAGSVRLRFLEGHLVVGGRKAPFFDGVYVITLEGAARTWRDSGLTCIRWD